MVITGRISKQKVQIMLEYITKGAEIFRRNSEKFNKGIEAQAALTESLTKKQKASANSTAMSSVANQGFNKVMSMGQPALKSFNEQGRKFNTIGGQMANRFRLATHGLRGFRMEMLGVMFFGMAMQRVFSGLLKTSLTWVGVTEILTTALGILFLPIAMMILDWAIAFLGWVNQLTEAQKLLYGKIVLVAIALGAFLFVVGTLFLGIGSLILVFGALSTPILLVMGALAALAAFVIGTTVFSSLSKDASELDNVMTQGLDFGALLERLKEGVKKAIDWLTEKLPEWTEKGLAMMAALFEGMAEKTDEIKEVMATLIEKMVTWIGENTPEIIKIGLAIADGIVTGLMKGLANVKGMIKDWIRDSLGIKEGGVLDKGLDLAYKAAEFGNFGLGGGIPGSQSAKNFISGFSNNNRNPTTDIGLQSQVSNATPVSNVTITNHNNVTVSDKSEFESMLNEYSRNQDDEIKRIFKIV